MRTVLKKKKPGKILRPKHSFPAFYLLGRRGSSTFKRVILFAITDFPIIKTQKRQSTLSILTN
jgi:hypothetical protein